VKLAAGGRWWPHHQEIESQGTMANALLKKKGGASDFRRNYGSQRRKCIVQAGKWKKMKRNSPDITAQAAELASISE